MKKIIIFILLTSGFQSLFAQIETMLITRTLNDYIEGTANGQPERLKNAFHPDFNLYYVGQDSLRIWKGKEYVDNIKVKASPF